MLSTTIGGITVTHVYVSLPDAKLVMESIFVGHLDKHYLIRLSAWLPMW